MKRKVLTLAIGLGFFAGVSFADHHLKLKPLPDRPPDPPDNPTTPEKVELGKFLYFDPRLSGDGSTSCATCHDPSEAWGKNQVMSPAYPGNEHFRHSPTILNSAYNSLMFWDGRVKTLEEQAKKPIISPFEMNLHYDLMIERLRAISKYREMFKKAFPNEKEPITLENTVKAIAAFERTIVCNDTPLDRYLRGESNALNKKQKLGLRLFTGKAGCIQCHNGANLTDNKFHITGVPKSKAEDNTLTKITRNFAIRQFGFANPYQFNRDLGRFFITKNPKDKGAFKTPTLRNVALTPPYMHNGAFKTLREVVEFYNKGGGNVPNKDPLLKPLNLSEEEKSALIAFLKALTCENIPQVEEPELPDFDEN